METLYKVALTHEEVIEVRAILEHEVIEYFTSDEKEEIAFFQAILDKLDTAILEV